MFAEKQVLWLYDRIPNPALIGAKAANLSRLHHAGFPVPDGFCIPMNAFPGEARSRYPESAQDENEFILSAGLTTGILQAYEDLLCRFGRDSRVAVRSSASSEDAADASFAGQYQSFLNIAGEKELLEAIQCCYASVNSENVSVYKEYKDAPGGTGMAILVQVMVPSEISGISFTINPVTGTDHQMVLEIVPKDGEAFASGKLTPARYIIDKKTRAIVQSENIESISEEFRTEDILEEIVDLCKKVEDYFNCPQDIEWAFHSHKFWLIQSRPITLDVSTFDERFLTRANVGEVMPEVLTPLTLSVFLLALRLGERGKKQGARNILKVVNGRAYMDIRMLWAGYSDIYGVNPATVLSKGIGCSTTEINGLVLSGPLKTGILKKSAKSVYIWAELSTLLLEKPRLEKKLKDMLSSATTPTLCDSDQANGAETIISALNDLHLRSSRLFVIHMKASFFACCAYAAARDRIAGILGEELADRAVAFSGFKSEKSELLAKELRALVGDIKRSDEYFDLFANHSTNEDLLSHLAESPTGKELLARINRIVDKAGNCSVNEFELMSHSWSDDPRSLIGAVRTMLEDKEGGREYANDSAVQSIQTLQPLIGAPLIKRCFLKRVYHSFLAYSHLREATKAALSQNISRLRKYYRSVGGHLQSNRILMDASDVFFLKADEVTSLLKSRTADWKLAELIRCRKEEYEKNCKMGGAALDLKEAQCAGYLSGIGVSGGKVTGKARIATDAGKIVLNRGEILVAEFTDPGWTPLFLVSDGLVAEIGGMLSHTATLARELRKPAVFSVPHATQIIKEGQLITVDGNQGKVYLS